jgi:hypothetical protein
MQFVVSVQIDGTRANHGEVIDALD